MAVYALALTLGVQSPNILLSRPRVLFALFVIVSQCLFQHKSFVIVMPRYLVELEQNAP